MPVGTSNRKPEPQLGGGGKLPWQGYTWDPRWITENESLWSILHKFASVNVMTAKDVQQIFKYDDDQRLIHSWTDRNRDLRTAGALDLEKIGRLLVYPSVFLPPPPFWNHVFRHISPVTPVHDYDCAGYVFITVITASSFKSLVWSIAHCI